MTDPTPEEIEAAALRLREPVARVLYNRILWRSLLAANAAPLSWEQCGSHRRKPWLDDAEAVIWMIRKERKP